MAKNRTKSSELAGKKTAANTAIPMAALSESQAAGHSKQDFAYSDVSALHDLSNTVGNFIRYWGFRRIHGQIWTQIYLSAEPLSGVELTRRLKVSKALVSPALAELVEHNLIHALDEQSKIKRFAANRDIFSVIKHVLKTREQVLIQETERAFQKLQKEQLRNPKLGDMLNKESLQNLGDMIECAQTAIQFVVSTSSEEDMHNWSKLLVD